MSTSLRRLTVIVLAMVVGACTNSATRDDASGDESSFLAPLEGNTTGVSALPEVEVAAIVALGATEAGRPPEEEHHHHQHGGSHSPAEVSAAEQPLLNAEISQARAVIRDFDTIEEATARGFVLATSPSPGIGTHWVRWSRILEPFAPDTPSMLLFDHTKSPPVLVGYSYAVQSAQEPQGFTGASDVWHRHAGLCVALSGWVIRERSAGPDDCAGSYIAGGDFWMLHAWIVPGWENRDGMFAPANEKLCPPKSGPDFLWCET